MRFKEFLALENTQREYSDEEEWMDAVKKAHPDVAPQLKFKGRVESGKSTISAELPGEDRSYGVFDNDSGKGIVLEALGKDGKPKVHSVPKGTMPKAELSVIGKSANPEKGKIAKREVDLSDPFAYPGDDVVFGKCNYDERIKPRKKGEKADPDYLGDILHFAHERDGKLYGFGSDGKANHKDALGTIKVVGKTKLQNPMTELWHDAQTLEIYLNVGAIIPAVRLKPTSVISQNHSWKAYVPTGWSKIINAVKNASASSLPMDELVRDALKKPKK